MDNLITAYIIGVILMVPVTTSLIIKRSSTRSKADTAASIVAGLMLGIAWPWFMTKWIILKLRT